jgi:hypothetical protein
VRNRETGIDVRSKLGAIINGNPREVDEATWNNFKGLLPETRVVGLIEKLQARLTVLLCT